MTRVLCALFLLLTGCASEHTIGQLVPGKTPFDQRWERVQEGMEQARAIQYVPDHQGEHWQTPAETAARGAGDCEDMAIWLYAWLRERGLSGVYLACGHVGSGGGPVGHAWVLWRSECGDYLLDPTMGWALDTWHPTAQQYRLLYAFDDGGSYRVKHQTYVAETL